MKELLYYWLEKCAKVFVFLWMISELIISLSDWSIINPYHWTVMGVRSIFLGGATGLFWGFVTFPFFLIYYKLRNNHAA